MISLTQIQTVACPRSSILEHAEDFIQKFNTSWGELTGNNKSLRLSKSFILEECNGSSFYQDLSLCFKKHQLNKLSVLFDEFWDKKSNVIDFNKVLDQILELNADQLKNLSTFHSNIVQSDVDHLPDESFRDVIEHFDGSLHNPNDRVEAGHLIMLLSQYAREVLLLKNIFNKFKPLTLGKIDELLEFPKSATDSKFQSDVDDSLEVVSSIQTCLKEHESKLIEIKVWCNKLSRQKRDILKLMMQSVSLTIKSSSDRMKKAIRAFKAWGEWKVLCRYDVKAESSIEDSSFLEAMNTVKDQLHSYSQRFMVMLDAMDVILNKGVSGISLYCQELLNELKSVFGSVLEQGDLALSLKKMLQKIQLKIQSIGHKIKNHLEYEIEEVRDLPENLQRRVLYLSYEVPRILARGYSNEIKNMALVVNFNYRLAKLQMGKKAYDHLDQATKDSLTKLLQNRTTKIVQNSSELVRLMVPQGA